MSLVTILDIDSDDEERAPFLSSKSNINRSPDDEDSPIPNLHPPNSRSISDSPQVAFLARARKISAFLWGPLISILLIGLVKPICFDVIYPFINKMILENEIVNDPEKVGFYTGRIESLFALMSFTSILPWTFASDRLGRKPIVLLGAAGMGISIALFGISKSFWMMTTTSCMEGIFAGTRSIMEVLLAETFPVKADRITVFAANQISFQVGQIVGQSLGGSLSHPERTTAFFDTPFWLKFPFSLPCFVACVYAVMSMLVGSLIIDETLPSSRSIHHHRHSAELMSDDDDRPPIKHVTIRSVLTPHVLSVLTSLFSMVLLSEMFFAVYPLFAFTPITSGGLGLSEAQIGAHMSLRSILTIAMFVFGAPIQRFFGPLRTYRTAMAFWSLSALLLPVLNTLARTRSYGVGSVPFNVALAALFSCWSVASLGWPSSNIIVVEAPPYPEALATVTGVAYMAQSLGQAAAPAFGTALFAASIRSHIFGGNAVYIVLVALSSVAVAQSWTLKDVSPDPREE